MAVKFGVGCANPHPQGDGTPLLLPPANSNPPLGFIHLLSLVLMNLPFLYLHLLLLLAIWTNLWLCVFWVKFGEIMCLFLLLFTKLSLTGNFLEVNVDLAGNWISLKFANVEDKEMVSRGRPWYVSSFSFVLSRWAPFFDPFSTCIDRIDH